MGAERLCLFAINILLFYIIFVQKSPRVPDTRSKGKKKKIKQKCICWARAYVLCMYEYDIRNNNNKNVKYDFDFGEDNTESICQSSETFFLLFFLFGF